MGDLWELGVQPVSTFHVVELCWLHPWHWYPMPAHQSHADGLLRASLVALEWNVHTAAERLYSVQSWHSRTRARTQYSSHGPSVNTGKHSRRSAGGWSNALHKTFTLICHRNSIVSALQWGARLTNARQGKLVCHLKPHRSLGSGSPRSLQIHPLHRNLPNQRQKLRPESGPFT